MIKGVYNNQRIVKALRQSGLIDETKLNAALREAEEKGGEFLGKILVEKEYITEEELASHFVEIWGCPLFQFTEDAEVNIESVKLIPKETAKKYLLIPIDNIGGIVTLCSAGPLETYVAREKIKELKNLKGCSLRYQIGLISEIEQAIEKYYK